MKRIAIATLSGVGLGVICATLLFSYGVLKYSAVALIWVLLNRAVMGYAIGISRLKLHWAWNGIIVGLVVGSVFSYFLFMTVGLSTLPFANFLANGLFGLIIEFFTSVVFKQAAQPRSLAPQKATVA